MRTEKIYPSREMTGTQQLITLVVCVLVPPFAPFIAIAYIAGLFIRKEVVVLEKGDKHYRG